MSVVISGALIDGAGIPMSGCHIILKSRVNTSEVVMRTVADVVTGNCGEYCFKAQTGKYCVYLKQDWRDEYCVGDIAVYDDSRPGTLNDFLTALDEGDLKPDVVKRFEEMVAQAQQSAEAAAESEQQAGQHVADAQQIKSDCETLADNVQQNAEAVAKDKKQVAQLASSATQDAARAEQAVKDADTIVKKAVDKLGEAATLTGEAKASAEAAAKSEQNAKQHKDEAQRIVDDLKGSNASTTEKGLVQLCSDTDNDSEELAATPKAVKTVMDETKTKAPLDSPAFTGTPTTPTPPDDAVGLEMANVAFVRKLLAALVDSSPEALDTLNELAAALGNDPNFATTIMNALAGKQPLSDVLTAISNLEERADNLLCFNQDGNASLSPLSEKARSLLAQATVEAMRNELELKSAAVKDIQTDLYDSTEGRVALPGAFGYGMTDAGASSIIARDMATIAKSAHNLHPGRYYTFSTQTEETTGITEIIWLDNGWDDKTSQTATKLVLFFGKDGRILMTVRGDNISAPVTWTNLTPQLGNAAQKDAQENIYDRAEGRLAITGMFGFGKVFSSGDRTEFKTEADFLRWVKMAKPGRYVVYGADKVIPGVLFSGTVEIIWPEPQANPNPAYVPKIIIFYGINGHIYYNRYWNAGDGYLVGWENLKVNEASLRALIETRAPLNSPALTGTPSTPTPPDDAAGNEIVNAAFVRKLLAALVDSSPEALDTLNELAAALGNDPEFATTITNALAGKQPLNDVLTAVSQITPEENTLPYFSAEGRILLAQLSEKARALLALDTPEAMRTELELKAAATMEPQSDIRDRTPGRLALSGMYGFGQAFASTDARAFNGQADFAEWLKEATPGRYAVSIADSSTLLAGTTKFNGIIDVMWSPFDNDESDAIRKFKTAVFYNQYYEGEHSIHRLTYRWSGNNWNATVSPVIYDGDSLAYLLSRMAGSGSYYKYPAVGVPVLAVYQGTAAGDKAIKIGLGDIVPGSRLGPVTITCSINDAGSYVSTPRVSAGGAGAFSFPGRYQALSGFSNSYGDEGRICLFVRIE
ncbi:prophage tail fiber N-terminal domain-containing protein [Escherichia coli]|uniref:prophage tail fiber N-terminal domain-containing protein n=7 Tax=Escherichia coli TaxID=562 RepID=UPI0007A5B929|nr:prophage tail fiber N-terminal domain-containing protein [Escherichia coli]MCK0809488.1 prophage tail fiber N-terminal domain-containing protein [Escherichia coli]MCK3218283.1 prophage tail fiber N-terminal domain-containing protein [Escherichia coli]MCK3464001.1 prophage tail fiber N-terminal domain-containing protein [Escherichia coli]MCK3469698.1 prophage tail fiber N-terminal domain-containing protein [Escherichia coli]MCK3521566.1 prophage tail fiber N-terminal domain-containing protei